ncbi:peptidoglycan recognition protein family protein [Planobispora rosea]|uniref:peptidoglycan recognition protein family protein n=1 Tax=Planobispora rosea TaxID=35762 RepID=UPI000A4A6A08|nr:peptidoglycan-binding domain-containing protein [Planobispora rosea]
MKITTRAGWNAAKAGTVYKVTWDERKEFVVHHTAGPKTQTPKQIQAFHMGPERGWSDVGYNFLVDQHGVVYEGRGWLGVGAHCPGHNRSGIGVAYIGDNNPTDEAKKSIRALYDEACRRAGRKLAKRGHGQLYSTSCPGGKLQSWVNQGMPVAAKPIIIRYENGVPLFPGRVLKFTKPMMHGPDVEIWQDKLAERGWEVDVDGWYGPKSAAVCERYQDAVGLKPTGRVDRATWELSWSWKPPAK